MFSKQYGYDYIDKVVDFLVTELHFVSFNVFEDHKLLSSG